MNKYVAFLDILGFKNKLKQLGQATAKQYISAFSSTAQDNPREVWLNVPNQDFTDNSDIDWTKSVPEIDKQLYSKYGV